ncbi:MAG: aminotransferase class I/II-fold pyridoxal phosphate-dependent enzyme [Elusimicrobia bacterium]|jgi:perosamine synthetase|nr:aminotransferase class I/II-fold pyridoxal phosphate-dependent enzyme [Elusimicrobiota bacterium]
MIPISGTKFSPFILFSKITDKKFSNQLADFLGRKKCFLFSSGGEALYVILKILRKKSGKNKVIIPAYCPNTVYVAAKSAGCRVVFCDMSISSFNMDLKHLEKLTDRDTLAVIAVHLFGIPEEMEKIKKITQDSGAVIIDDFCQAFGSKYKGKHAGDFGVASVLSFGKGKNFTTFSGGALFIDEKELIEKVNYIVNKLPSPKFKRNVMVAIKIAILSIVSRPLFYGISYRILSKFREMSAPDKINLKKMTKIQKRVGSSLYKKIKDIFIYRNKTGAVIYEIFKGNKNFMVPLLEKDKYVVFNRVPLIVKDKNKRENLRASLMKAGIETNYLYKKPVFDYYDIKVDISKYKNAIYLAEHVITLPSNVFLKSRSIEKIKKCI